MFGPANDEAPDDDMVVRGPASYMRPSKALTQQIVEAAADFAPEAILFGAPHPLSAMGPALRDRLGVPFAVLSHGAEVTLPAAAPGTRQLLAKWLKAADVRFAVSRFTGERVRRLTGKDVTFLGAGVEVDTFVPADPRPTNDIPVVGCVSRFVPRKGQDRLLEACARLDRPVKVLLVGKGRTEEALRKQARQLDLDVEFAVDVPWSELPGLYQRMDVFCMPTSSRWAGLEVEGLGLVYLEASATALPVLAGDSGGSPETVLPGETGYVVSDVDDIVEGLSILLDDPVRAAEMGRIGRAFVEQEFTWERVIERFDAGFAPHLQ